MKPLLFLVLLTMALKPAFAQTIASTVYSWKQAPILKQTSFEDRTLLEGSTRDFSSLSLHAITLFAHQPAQPDQQLDEEALLIIKEGHLTLTLGQKTKTLGPGSVVLIMPGDFYRIGNQTNQSLTYYLMRYTSNEVPDLDLYRLAGGSFWVDWKEIPFTPHDKGGIRRMIDCATIMSKRFEMHVTTLNAVLWSHPPHTHRAAEILIMIDNIAQESIDGVLKPASAGDVIFLDANVPHAIQNTSQQGSCSYFAFQFE